MASHNPHTPPEHRDGSGAGDDEYNSPYYLTGVHRIVRRLQQFDGNVPDVGEHHSAENRETMTDLAWRPAWGIRSRRGSWGYIRAWLRSLWPRQSR